MRAITFSKRGRRFVPVILSLFFALVLVMPAILHAAMTVTADNASNPLGAEVSVTATVTPDIFLWWPGLTFAVVDGPNVGILEEVGTVYEGNNSVATFTYTSNGEPGIDTIEVYVNYWGGSYDSKVSTTVEWINTSPTFNLVVRPKLNVNSHGKLSITVCGSSDFNVNSIVPDSMKLEGVPAVRQAFADVQGTSGGTDGFGDLILKFKTRDIAAALGEVEDGEVRVLTLTGSLSNGTPLAADFEMTMINKGKHNNKHKHNKVKKEKKEK